MDNRYKYVVFTDFQIPVFCPKCLQLFQHAASFGTFPLKKKKLFISREFPNTDYMEAQLILNKNYLHNKPIYCTYKVGKTCCILLWSMVSSMIWGRLGFYSILLSNMQSSSMMQKVMVLSLEQNQNLCFFTTTGRIVIMKKG